MAKKATKPRKRAQKTHVAYEPDRHPEMARCLCMAGKIDVEACAIMGISKQTWHNWKKKYPEFADAVAGGKDVANDRVEESLFKRTQGYEYEEVTITGEDDGQGGIKKRRVTKTKKHMPASDTAIIWWQKNRQPDKWMDKQHLEHTGDLNISVKDPDGWGEGEYQAPDETE